MKRLCFFAHDIVLLASSVSDLNHVAGQFPGECEVAGIRFKMSKFDPIVLCWKTIHCSLEVGSGGLQKSLRKSGTCYLCLVEMLRYLYYCSVAKMLPMKRLGVFKVDYTAPQFPPFTPTDHKTLTCSMSGTVSFWTLNYTLRTPKFREYLVSHPISSAHAVVYMFTWGIQIGLKIDLSILRSYPCRGRLNYICRVWKKFLQTLSTTCPTCF